MVKIRPTFLITFLFCTLIFTSCKNATEEPGIETSNNTETVGVLTDSEFISEFFTDSTATNKNLSLQRKEEVTAFYQKQDYKPVWVNAGLRESLFRNIENIDQEGLDPEDYHKTYLKESLSNLQNLNKEEQFKLEISLTDNFLQLAHDLYYGKLNPNELFEIWDLNKEDVDLTSLLEKAINEEDIEATLNSIKPDHPVYHGLKKSLAEYDKLRTQEKNITTIASGETIKPNENDPRIPSIVQRLEELGFPVEADSITNSYTPEIQKAIKDYQLRYGIEVDGVIGAGTISNLNKNSEERHHQVLANMERWRWFPRDFGDHYILVNIPNYRLTVVRDNDTISTHKVMVGTQARKTPVFSDKIQYVVYNPTWTIPPTIKKKDVIPGAARDISYLSKRNITIYNKDGEEVDPADINFDSGEGMSYTFRQKAGSSNPLGQVKIIYPNEYLIYLHDTPSKALFERNSRAESSGCVRVQGAIELSKYLLKNRSQYSSEKIDDIIASGKTTQIEVTQSVKVHHLYWTSWREDGEARFTADIYGTDEKIYNLLKD
ncbi:L,D-transpeptidase family protein [Salegentibacter sp. F188]|uniref:L,D-transpeptidase family protein n=1 Tax=Autumnicola patrickiae TaxID=3075591 RepID=A0ABU3E4Y3_9FLAO|nr:L,D-transpeptidase family protein [Salegentibacter sp. F188]MDT0691056.1 L,D-transpeptidase family protein [Salegentibacter sp. F188]